MWIYNDYEQDRVVELYYKKFGKIIRNVEAVYWNEEEQEYTINTESTQYSIHTKRLA